MAALDDIVRGIASNVKAARRGVFLQPASEQLIRPQADVLREAVDPSRAREGIEYLSEYMDPDLIPASTIAAGKLGPYGQSRLLNSLALRQEAPDLAKDVHNLAALTPNQLSYVWDELIDDGPIPKELADYINDIGGLYTVGSAQRAIDSGSRGGDVPLDVLSLFDPKDIPGVSQAIREISLRNLARNNVKLDDELLLFRNPRFLVDIPGRTSGTLSYTRTPGELAETYGMSYKDFSPFVVKARDIRTDVPAITQSTSAKYNPSWQGESEVQALSSRVNPYTFSQLMGMINKYGSIEEMLRAQQRFGTDPYLSNLPGLGEWTQDGMLKTTLRDAETEGIQTKVIPTWGYR